MSGLSGVDCMVLVDGVRVADGSPDEPGLAPSVLSSLIIDWGRMNTVDQPDPATCTFKVQYPADQGKTVGSQLDAGTMIDVVTTATLWHEADVDTLTDGDFETDAETWIVGPGSGSAALDGRQPVAGASALAWRLPFRSADAVGPRLAIAPAEPATTNDPAAWDGLVRGSVGQVWRFTGSVLIPPAVVVDVAPIVFRDPRRVDRWLDPGQTLVGSGSWQPFDFELRIDTGVAGDWLGVGFTARPAAGIRAGAPVGARYWDVSPDARVWELEPSLRTSDLGTIWVDELAVLAPSGGELRDVTIFEGRITDAEAYAGTPWVDEDTGVVVETGLLEVIAADFTADLESRMVGDEPWPEEPLGERMWKILELAGWDLTQNTAPTLAEIPVSWLDVDRQPAAGLLRDLAQTVDGVLWASAHRITGQYLRLEDPAMRESGWSLVWEGNPPWQPPDVPDPDPIIRYTQEWAGTPGDSASLQRDAVTRQLVRRNMIHRTSGPTSTTPAAAAAWNTAALVAFDQATHSTIITPTEAS